LIPLTGAKARSRGAVTRRSLVAGSIAVVCAVTTTTGKVISGKRASFREKKLHRPSAERAIHSPNVAQG